MPASRNVMARLQVFILPDGETHHAQVGFGDTAQCPLLADFVEKVGAGARRHSCACWTRDLCSSGCHCLRPIGEELCEHPEVLGCSGQMELVPGSIRAAQAQPVEPQDALQMSPLEDQQLAGLIMWIPGGLVSAGAALALAAKWISRVSAHGESLAAGAGSRSITPCRSLRCLLAIPRESSRKHGHFLMEEIPVPPGQFSIESTRSARKRRSISSIA